MWTPEHVGALLATAIAAAGLVVLARRNQNWWWLRLLAAVLVADEIVWLATVVAGGGEPGQRAQPLPLQVCDVAIFVAALALWTRNQLAVEVTYFWGLAGTIQGLLTPDLPQHFPNYLYFQYYIAHGGVVTAALVLVVGLRLYPRRLALIRIAGLTAAYAIFVGLVDAATGADYMYLRAKPASASLLDVLGPWPVYILSATVVAIVLFVVLDTPFRLSRRERLEQLQKPGSPCGKLS